jgi:hypothetical protein
MLLDRLGRGVESARSLARDGSHIARSLFSRSGTSPALLRNRSHHGADAQLVWFTSPSIH